MTPKQIARAWHSVSDEWIVRRNKSHNDGRQWEVVQDWGGDVIDDATMKVVGRYANSVRAERMAAQFENVARATAVLRALGQ